MLLVASWVLVALGSLVDLQIKDRLYFSPTVHDYSVRAPITAAISRTGVPPPNPFFFPAAPVPLRYHYFWYIPGSFVDQLGGKEVSPRQALIAGTVWCGIALMALIPLYFRFFHPMGAENVHRRSLLGVALLAVTGLDLIPTLFLMKFGNRVLQDMEWWNEQVASWLHSLLWVPHHVIAMIACSTGFLLLWCIERGSSGRAHVLLAACAFASAAGSSIYVSLVFAVFLVVWCALMMARRCYRECLAIVAAGTLAGILALPHLLSLLPHTPATGGSAGKTFFGFSVRPFTAAEILLRDSNLGAWTIQSIYTALLPLNYFLELGFFFVVAWATLNKYRKSRMTRQQMALSTLLITSVAICTFVRSSVITSNDLGWRGFLFAQFVLILWSVDFWPSWSRLRGPGRITLQIILLLGAAGTAYQGFMLRAFPILADRGTIAMHDTLAPDHQLGRRTMAMRRAYARLDAILPEGARLQFNPTQVPNGYFCGMYANRQVVAFDLGCGAVFGGNSQSCNNIISQIVPLYAPSSSPPPANLDPIDVLIFQDTDPVWADRSSWIWQVQPLVSNEFFRAIPARTSLRWQSMD